MGSAEAKDSLSRSPSSTSFLLESSTWLISNDMTPRLSPSRVTFDWMECAPVAAFTPAFGDPLEGTLAYVAVVNVVAVVFEFDLFNAYQFTNISYVWEKCNNR